MDNAIGTGSDKLITFAIPCYNSAAYMDTCIQTILDGCADRLDQTEILIVDDGSTKDDTAAKADAWQEAYPGVIRALHQQNAGHGGAVNTGLAHARGLYFKVVDSDDWLDVESCKMVIELIAVFARRPSDDPIDLLLCNYVYEHAERGQTFIDYKNVFPVGREFTWDEMGRFPITDYILMHSVIYRTQVLRDCGLVLPEHCFYVDNIFVYVPLPHVRKIFYMDLDLYRYFIGRDDQSVNEKVMAGRIEQQLRVTREMIDAYDLDNDIDSPKLRAYMKRDLLMMMTISTVFSVLSKREDRHELRDGIWRYLEQHRPATYRDLKRTFFGLGCGLPGEPGGWVIESLYRLSKRFVKFN